MKKFGNSKEVFGLVVEALPRTRGGRNLCRSRSVAPFHLLRCAGERGEEIRRWHVIPAIHRQITPGLDAIEGGEQKFLNLPVESHLPGSHRREQRLRLVRQDLEAFE